MFKIIHFRANCQANYGKYSGLGQPCSLENVYLAGGDDIDMQDGGDLLPPPLTAARAPTSLYLLGTIPLFLREQAE